DWRPPAAGDPAAVRALTDLYGPRSEAVETANAEVFRRLDQGAPVFVDVCRAVDVIPGFGERMLLHPGPPLAWDEVCDPLRRARRAAVVAGGWAPDVPAAHAMLAAGEVTFAAAGEHATVVPMATALGPSMPVCVVDNRDGGTRAYAPVSQGSGDVAW